MVLKEEVLYKTKANYIDCKIPGNKLCTAV